MSDIPARTLYILAGAAAAALVVGRLFGATFGWGLICLVLFVLLVHHVRHLELLRRWVLNADQEVPGATGVWDEIFALLYRQRRYEARQRVQLARALAESREVGRALPYGVAVLDAENRIVWCNSSSERHFDLNAEADAGHPITNLVRRPEFVDYIAAGDYSSPLQLKAAQPDGLVVSVQLIPYGESQRLLLSRDVTQASKLETMRRDFVANVSHELRTPLTVLVGFLETLRELKLDAERSRDYLNLMQEQGSRMQRIIDDLLTLSMLESAPGPAYDGRVDMTALLRRVHRDAEALSAGRHTIRLDIGAERDVLGSEDELAGAFANLVSNAVRYTPAGGEIRITWRIREPGVEFAVEDTGPGIAPEHIPRLTERFYRVDRGRSRDTGGTGLGLAIVKHALARHQADLHIESEVGKGSRFSARFPARRLAPRSVANVKG